MQTYFDIIITGAGPAGIAAGVSAIQTGLRTLIVHADPEIGGQATNIYVGTICGVHSRFSGKDNIVGKFPRKFTKRLAELSNTAPVTNHSGLSYLPYRREEFGKLANELLTGNKLDIINNTRVTKVNTDKNSILSLEITDDTKTQEVGARIFIDCSGNGMLSILGKGALIENKEYQYTSIVAGLKGIHEKDEQVLKLTLYKALEEAFREGKIKVGGKSLTLVQGTSSTYQDEIFFKFNSFQNILNYQEEVSLLKEALDYLKSKDGFRDIRINFLSESKGIRSSTRPLGMTVLTDEMVKSSAKSPHTIARGIWPIELWKGSKPPLIEHLKNDDYYDIPYTCLLSKSFKNLLSAGRAISSEEKAHSSARVIGTSLQTGHASGFLANSMIKGQDIIEAVREYQNLENLR